MRDGIKSRSVQVSVAATAATHSCVPEHSGAIDLRCTAAIAQIYTFERGEITGLVMIDSRRKSTKTCVTTVS